MRKRFLVGEEVGVTFHWDAETLGENIVSCGGSLLGAFDVKLIGLIGNRLSKIRIRLDPHVRISDFLGIVKPIIEYGDMRIDVFPFENVHQLHLDGVADRISDRSLGRGGHDEIIVKLRSTLFDGADHILTNIAGQPFVNGRYLGTKTLELVD